MPINQEDFFACGGPEMCFRKLNPNICCLSENSFAEWRAVTRKYLTAKLSKKQQIFGLRNVNEKIEWEYFKPLRGPLTIFLSSNSEGHKFEMESLRLSFSFQFLIGTCHTYYNIRDLSALPIFLNIPSSEDILNISFPLSSRQINHSIKLWGGKWSKWERAQREKTCRYLKIIISHSPPFKLK